MAHMHSSSPPPVPLRHPVPTHPAYIPEPPSTPSSPQGYQRFSSSPGPVPPQQPLPPPHQAAGAYSTSSGSSGGGGGYQPYVPAYAGAFGSSGAASGMQAHHQQQQQGQQPYGGGYGGGHGQQQAQGHMGQGPPGQMGGQGFHPNFGAWGINDTTAQLGMQLGQSAVAAGQDYVQKNFATLLPQQTLKHHFNVSNSYVLSKMRLLLFPWMHKPWARRTKRVDVQGGGANHEWCTPREDVNSPDLYIPVMAIVTYILLTGLHAGINSMKGFKPQILGESASRATLVVMFDFLFVKLGCYILNIPTLAPSTSTSSFAPSSQLVDIFAYTGYKFVGVIATLSAGFLGLKGVLWWGVFVYCFLGNAFFMLRSLRSLVLPDPSIAIPASSGASTVNPAQRRRRITFLFIEACMQVLYMGALVRLG